MATYGRNFEFLVSPDGKNRDGRNVLDVVQPIGAPVVFDAGADVPAVGTGARAVTLAAADATPTPGLCGIAVFEHFLIEDQAALVVASDLDTCPAGQMLQVVSGTETVVRLRNTEDRTFLNTRSYTGRTMVAGLGATPTLVVGDYLTPGVGNDTDGYWKETAVAADAWLVITNVDADRGEVEARLLF